MASTVNSVAFREENGYISPPLSLDKRMIVFTVSEVAKEQVKPLEDVRTQIETKLKREAQTNLAMKDCHAFAEKIKSADFESAAESDSLEISDTGLFAFNASITGVGQDPIFAGTAYQLQPGDVSAPFEGDKGWYILKAIERLDASAEPDESEKETLRSELENQKMNQTFQVWLKNLKDNADIEDYREDYF